MRLSVESHLNVTPKVLQVASLFDLEVGRSSRLTWVVELPLGAQAWQIGLIPALWTKQRLRLHYTYVHLSGRLKKCARREFRPRRRNRSTQGKRFESTGVMTPAKGNCGG
jgi:hypothetical protein